MQMNPPRFTHIRIGIQEGKIDQIHDENNHSPSTVDPADIAKIKKEGKLIAEIYRTEFSPVCTVVIRSDGTAVKICR